MGREWFSGLRVAQTVILGLKREHVTSTMVLISGQSIEPFIQMGSLDGQQDSSATSEPTTVIPRL